jgi:prepilin-type N-terminal cleavage/methylation domain-containing protein
MTSTRAQGGFSLIELMVTILISSLLLLGVLQLFINTSDTDRTSNELARVQENGRLVLELITREARRAGYQGCVPASNSTVSDGITYPDDALAGTDTSLTFRYARLDPDGTFPNRDCDNSTLSAYQITFSNCDANICITAPDIGNNQQLVTNANITNIQYLQPCADRVCVRQAADADLEQTTKLQITLAISDARGEFDQPRTFTSVIELRNRL